METILAAGATGECVVKLTALARAAGINITQYDTDKPLAAADLETIAGAVSYPVDMVLDLPNGQTIKGRLITQPIWDELIVRAAANTGLAFVPNPTTPAPSPSSSASSQSASPTSSPEPPATGTSEPWAASEPTAPTASGAPGDAGDPVT